LLSSINEEEPLLLDLKFDEEFWTLAEFLGFDSAFLSLASIILLCWVKGVWGTSSFMRNLILEFFSSSYSYS
jgi:hypothetical protein